MKNLTGLTCWSNQYPAAMIAAEWPPDSTGVFIYPVLQGVSPVRRYTNALTVSFLIDQGL